MALVEIIMHGDWGVLAMCLSAFTGICPTMQWADIMAITVVGMAAMVALAVLEMEMAMDLLVAVR